MMDYKTINSLLEERDKTTKRICHVVAPHILKILKTEYKQAGRKYLAYGDLFSKLIKNIPLLNYDVYDATLQSLYCSGKISPLSHYSLDAVKLNVEKK